MSSKMDIETKSINGTLVPYCISLFDGKFSYSCYITNYKSLDEMLAQAIKFI